jgi:hypothetical protein
MHIAIRAVTAVFVLATLGNSNPHGHPIKTSSNHHQGASIANVIQSQPELDILFNLIGKPGQSNFNETTSGVALLGISLSSNLCATILVGFKAWYVNFRP